MPIYEYECSRCAHRIEILQKISEAPLRDCPSCNTPSLRKLVSAASFRLKGTGWYETDFKNKNNNPPKPEKEGNSATKGDGGNTNESKKDTPTSESKPKDAKKPDST
uniref:Putative regulatory protein, FmdB family n=1 Tax=Candidatus Kentrum sp. SD TaxID=2126332 RepID=A0A450YZP4_9GAMM|nr:MAG: putative regulatory protein, FmdB family [Candidatus Kentron sp. SD]VFK46972.1 MAG: putative regulatory protein, FmdB family [Candidatus Kentron sp. SD]VFK79939.1 MAG: putative regulatory protein, FmdB family [Candidatus Kentron sp. SD]